MLDQTQRGSHMVRLFITFSGKAIQFIYWLVFSIHSINPKAIEFLLDSHATIFHSFSLWSLQENHHWSIWLLTGPSSWPIPRWPSPGPTDFAEASSAPLPLLKSQRTRRESLSCFRILDLVCLSGSGIQAKQPPGLWPFPNSVSAISGTYNI